MARLVEEDPERRARLVRGPGRPELQHLGLGLAPLLLAVSAIAIVGNISAVRRLFAASVERPIAPSHPDFDTAHAPVAEVHHDPAE